jgi:hypothetical protein
MDLFLHSEVNPYGLFGVKFIHEGIVREVIVDSFIPID